MPGASVLDVGSGPGTITVDIAERVAPGRVIGIDASAEIVAQASTYASARGIDNVSFATGDAYRIEADDDTFDVVHAHQVLQHVSDPVAALAEFRRITKPGGVVAARDVDWGGTIWAPALPGLTEWMRINQAVQRNNGGDPCAGRMLTGWALAAGFERVDSGASIWCFASEAERAWWGDSWSVRARESDFATYALASGVADDAALDAVSAAWVEWSVAPDGWYAMPHGEIIAHV